MPTTKYHDKRGNRLPSVTQILSATWSSGDALIAWANREGLQGRSHTQKRDEAANIGTVAHEIVLARIGGPPTMLERFEPAVVSAARIPAHHAAEWIESHEIVPTLVETPIIHHKAGYGGTPDWYGEIDGVKTLIDIKTSSGIYARHWVQLAAYKIALEEHGHQVDRIAVLHLPRKLSGRAKYEGANDDLVAHYEAAWRLCLDLYRVKLTIGE